ncbi:MAG: amino acid ABC transporter permease [Thiogranum sp.]
MPDSVSNSTLAEQRAARAGRVVPISWERLPWWLLLVLFLGLLILFNVFISETYSDALRFISGISVTKVAETPQDEATQDEEAAKGWQLTVGSWRVTLLPEGIILTFISTIGGYALAAFIGLFTGLARTSKNVLIYTVATFYVEVVRGVPIIVQIIYWAFVVTPLLVQGFNSLGEYLLNNVGSAAFAISLAEMNIRAIPLNIRGVLALAIAYGAFEAEIYRAGIESIERGQMEAARASGMTYVQAMRYIILPQAIRRVLPPLGNDFIAMLKDSSLLSAIAVRELTQMGILNRSRTFRSVETYNLVAFLYLTMTLVLSMGVKFLERRMSIDE